MKQHLALKVSYHFSFIADKEKPKKTYEPSSSCFFAKARPRAFTRRRGRDNGKEANIWHFSRSICRNACYGKVHIAAMQFILSKQAKRGFLRSKGTNFHDKLMLKLFRSHVRFTGMALVYSLRSKECIFGQCFDKKNTVPAREDPCQRLLLP